MHESEQVAYLMTGHIGDRLGQLRHRRVQPQKRREGVCKYDGLLPGIGVELVHAFGDAE